MFVRIMSIKLAGSGSVLIVSSIRIKLRIPTGFEGGVSHPLDLTALFPQVAHRGRTCRLRPSQLAGAAGPGAALGLAAAVLPSCVLLVSPLCAPDFGFGGAVSAIPSSLRSCGGTVGLETTLLTSSRLSRLALGACSLRSCSRRSLTVLVAEEEDEVPFWAFWETPEPEGELCLCCACFVRSWRCFFGISDCVDVDDGDLGMEERLEWRSWHWLVYQRQSDSRQAAHVVRFEAWLEVQDRLAVTPGLWESDE